MGDYEGVEDTLFIPLTARVIISKKFPEYFFDEKALEMESLIAGKQIEKKIIPILHDCISCKVLQSR